MGIRNRPSHISSLDHFVRITAGPYGHLAAQFMTTLILTKMVRKCPEGGWGYKFSLAIIPIFVILTISTYL